MPAWSGQAGEGLIAGSDPQTLANKRRPVNEIAHFFNVSIAACAGKIIKVRNTVKILLRKRFKERVCESFFKS